MAINLLKSLAEERRLPVGRPDFKSGGMHAGVFGRFNSYLFRQLLSFLFVFSRFNSIKLWCSNPSLERRHSSLGGKDIS
jgi:hypothetical protein